jgi:hypothetical protein
MPWKILWRWTVFGVRVFPPFPLLLADVFDYQLLWCSSQEARIHICSADSPKFIFFCSQYSWVGKVLFGWHNIWISLYEIAHLAVSSEVHVPELLTHRAMICRIIPWSCARINRVDGYRSDIFWVYWIYQRLVGRGAP